MAEGAPDEFLKALNPDVSFPVPDVHPEDVWIPGLVQRKIEAARPFDEEFDEDIVEED